MSFLAVRGLYPRLREHDRTLGDDDGVAAYASLRESTRAANERFGEEDVEEWLEHAVDDEATD